MRRTRKQYSPKFKARVALESIRGERTLNQLASQFHVHPRSVIGGRRHWNSWRICSSSAARASARTGKWRRTPCTRRSAG